jgi:cysteine desulfurase
MRPIYLDYNATTPIDPLVVRAMQPYVGGADNTDLGEFGNPSSNHAYGRQARDAVNTARAQLAALIGANPSEIVFTGGGTEASNYAIKGLVPPKLMGAIRDQVHLVTSMVEHPATLQPCDFLRRLGCSVTFVPVDGMGRVDPDAIRRAITKATVLITIMHSNNEVGTLQPIREIAAIAREHGILTHTDAAQSIGKIEVNVNDLGVDLLTIAGHKLYAPKGVGALFVRNGVRLEPLIHGAGHEGGRRAGTENVPYIVALGMAAQIARQSLPEATEKLKSLRDRLENRLRVQLGDGLVLNGHRELRLPNTLNLSFPGCIGADLLAKVPDVAASTGSACHEGQVKMSPVLSAMGVPPHIGQGAVRLSVGRFTTEAEVDRAADSLARAAKLTGFDASRPSLH